MPLPRRPPPPPPPRSPPPPPPPPPPLNQTNATTYGAVSRVACGAVWARVCGWWLCVCRRSRRASCRVHDLFLNILSTIKGTGRVQPSRYEPPPLLQQSARVRDALFSGSFLPRFQWEGSNHMANPATESGLGRCNWAPSCCPSGGTTAHMEKADPNDVVAEEKAGFDVCFPDGRDAKVSRAVVSHPLARRGRVCS